MSQNQPKTGQKWLFPVGSGSVFHLAERPTEPLARCGFRPQGTQNGVFWVKINDDSPKAYCPDCGRWLKEHPEPAPTAWIPGPPTEIGAYWVMIDGVVRLTALYWGDRDKEWLLDTPGFGFKFFKHEDITHHIPLAKPEAP